MAEDKDKVKMQKSIPATKVQRAAKFAKTGVKVGRNYLKHFAKKVVNPQLSAESLHEDNARDIYDSLSELKGSALKVAQMMSMDKNILPTAYADRFQMAQYSAPPLSYPLVVRTFQKHFGKGPTELFDTFTKDAVNAASIGQVHKATKDGKALAVKVQYPGVADSVSSDLKLVKPFAVNILGLNESDVETYMVEVETMLLSETDYELELQRSIDIPKACAELTGVSFPTYYPEFSSKKILTMDWLDGHHLTEFMKTKPSQEVCDAIGQAMWDFYDFQIHELHQVHADPHPGNFIMQQNGTLGIIDFGCVKVIPDDFYQQYFELLEKELLDDSDTLMQKLLAFNYIYPNDTPDDKKVLLEIFKEIMSLLNRPFHAGIFDFGDDSYFVDLYEFGETHKNTPQLRKSKKPRGASQALYLNRTYFGLYNLLNKLGAKVNTKSRWFEQKGIQV